MEITWKLRMAAAQREVWTGTQLRRLLAERAGLELSSASAGPVHQATVPGQAVHPGCHLHGVGMHSQRPDRGRHHTH